MYLTRFFLDPESRVVRSLASDPVGLHRAVMRLFPKHDGPTPRRAHGVLHRLDGAAKGRVMLLVQSRVPPNVAEMPPNSMLDLTTDPELAFAGIRANAETRDVNQERVAIAKGDRFHFRLRANTTRKILTKTGSDGTRTHGKRVPVRGDEERLGWLKRHAEVAGFRFSDLRITELAAQQGSRRGATVALAGSLFDGVLEVEDVERFRAALETGIGPGKAFGFGLLSIRRA